MLTLQKSEDYGLLGRDAVYRNNIFLTFRRNQLLPALWYSTLVRIVSIFIPDYTASQARRQWY